jgi:hypothetical protein
MTNSRGISKTRPLHHRTRVLHETSVPKTPHPFLGPAPQVRPGHSSTCLKAHFASESLKRAFAEAHRNHLQSPSTHSPALFVDEPQSSVSLPDHGIKRRKTCAEASPHKSLFPASSKKAPITYGKLSKVGPNSPFRHIPNHESVLEATQNCTELAFDKIWDLPGTLREDYMQHDPNAMFPEPSSTIPNATLTQQRILEKVVAPPLLGTNSESDAPPYQPPPEPSVPWSDIMKFSSAGTPEQSDPANPRAEPEAASATLQQSPEQTKELLASQRSRRGSSVRTTDSPLRNDVSADNINPMDLMLSPHPVDVGQDLNLPPMPSKRPQHDILEENEYLSQQEITKISSLPVSQDDILVVDLPPEQYKPRPSRSRAQKVSTDELVDYSIRPEKAAKVKRRKTTTAAAATRSSAGELRSTPEKIEQICDMGFTPTSTGRALKQLNGDVTRAVEWLVTNGMGKDELAQSTPPRKRPVSKVPRSDRTSAPEEDRVMEASGIQVTTAAEEPSPATDTPIKSPIVSTAEVNSNTIIVQPNEDHVKSPKVQVVIPSKSTMSKPAQHIAEPAKLSTKKPKRRKTTSDVPEGEANLEPPLVAEVLTEKKKRGRPKKPKTAAISTDTLTMAEETLQGPGNESPEVIQTTEPGTTNTAISTRAEGHTSEDVQEQARASSIQPANPTPPQHARTPEGSSKSSPKPSIHSPAVKGKTPYRVGLSKRARIAPLLRIVKK